MASVNKVIIVGNLGTDPEVRYFPDGTAFVNISLATSSQWKDKASGERREETEWHRVVLRGRPAEVVGEYCKKGSSLYIEGRLKTRKWTDKEGVERYTTEIQADQMQLLGARGGVGGAAAAGAEFADFDDAYQGSSGSRSKPNSGAGTQTGRTAVGAGSNKGFDSLPDDDIPF